MIYAEDFKHKMQLSYQLFKNSKWNTITLFNIKENENNKNLYERKDKYENIYNIRQYANYYAINVLRMTQKEYYNQFRKNYNKTKSDILDEDTYILFEIIIDLNLFNSIHLYEEIKKHTKNENQLYNRNFLCSLIYKKKNNKSKLDIFFSLYQPENSPKKKAVQNNIRDLIDSLSVNYQEDNYYPIQLIKVFLNANIQSEEELLEFCKKNYITISDIEQAIYIMSYTNKEVYERSKELYKKIYTNNHLNKEEYTANTRIIGKKSYEYFVSVNYNANKLYDIVTEKLSIEKIRHSIKLYMIHDLEKLESEFYYPMHKNSNKKLRKDHLVLDELSDSSSSLSSLLIIVKKYYHDIYDTVIYKKLLDGIYPYILRRTNKQSLDNDELEYNLNKKVNLLREYIVRENQDKKREAANKTLIPKAIEVIRDYISQNMILNQYLSINNITISEYKKYKDIVKENDYELYLLLKNKNEKNSEKYYSTLLVKIRNIITMIQNENNKTFDILDYYHYIKIDPEELYSQLKSKLSKDETKTFKIFIQQNKNARKIKISNIIDERQTILVNGILHEVTFEEKTLVINYLKNNNIPLTDKIYYIAIRKYLNNELEINNNTNNHKGTK